MEAVSKESLEGMQLIPTPLRAEEEHRGLGKDYVSHSDWEPEDRAASFLPDWGSQGRAMPPSSDSQGLPSLFQGASLPSTLPLLHSPACPGRIPWWSQCSPGGEVRKHQATLQGSDALQALSVCPQDKFVLQHR